jgi:hypothetical protein
MKAPDGFQVESYGEFWKWYKFDSVRQSCPRKKV